MTKPTTEQWRDLHSAFREYCGLAPWRWLEDKDVLAVEHPTDEYTGYCIVLGNAGYEYGFAVYIGDEGLSAYLAVMTDEVSPESLDALAQMNALSALLADREDLDGTDRAIVRKLGLKYRGRGNWPLFRSTSPGLAPWRLDADEAVFLTLAIRNAINMASRIARGELSPYSEDDPSLILTRVFGDGAWRDEWRLLRPPGPPGPVAAYGDPDRLRRLAGSKPVEPTGWELSIFHIPTAVQDRKGTRPYLPTAILAVDRSSGLVLSANALGAAPSVAERQEHLVGLLEDADAAPSEIVADTQATARLVESIAGPLGIRLSTGATPALDEAREALIAYME